MHVYTPVITTDAIAQSLQKQSLSSGHDGSTVDASDAQEVMCMCIPPLSLLTPLLNPCRSS